MSSAAPKAGEVSPEADRFTLLFAKKVITSGNFNADNIDTASVSASKRPWP